MYMMLPKVEWEAIVAGAMDGKEIGEWNEPAAVVDRPVSGSCDGV
jgi:hypothetical protein